MGSEHEREPSAFGRALATRARPQLAMATPATAHRTIGRIARITTGFGRAVGRSTSVRPMVRRSDLNSTTLRPPPGFWMRPSVDEIEAAAPESPLGSAGQAASTTAVRRTFEPRPHPSRRTASSPSRPMSWTDRLVADSPGAAEPAPQPAPEIAPAPSRRQSPIEELQAMMDTGTLPHQVQGQLGERDSTAVRRSSDRNAAQTRAPLRLEPTTDTPDVAAEDSEDQDTGDEELSGLVRGDTKAGARTGPGILSQSLVPERGDHTPTPPTARRRRRPASDPDAANARPGRGIADLIPGPAPSPGSGNRTEPGSGRRTDDRTARSPDAVHRSTPFDARRVTASPNRERRDTTLDTTLDTPDTPDTPINADEMIRRDFASTPAPTHPQPDPPPAPPDSRTTPPRTDPVPFAARRGDPRSETESGTSIADSSTQSSAQGIAQTSGHATDPGRAVRPIMPSLPGNPLRSVSGAAANATIGSAPGGDRSAPHTITRAPAGSVAVLRRVTLPRATSTMHRPPSALPRFHRSGDTVTQIPDFSSIPARSAPPRSGPDDLTEPATSAPSTSASPSTDSPVASAPMIDGPTTDSASHGFTVIESLSPQAAPSDTSRWSPPATTNPDGLTVRPDGGPRTNRHAATPTVDTQRPAGSSARDDAALPRVSVLRSDEIVRRAPDPTPAPNRTGGPDGPTNSMISGGAPLWTPSTPPRNSVVARGPGALLDVIRRAVRRSVAADPVPPVASHDQLAARATDRNGPTSRSDVRAHAPLAGPASAIPTDSSGGADLIANDIGSTALETSPDTVARSVAPALGNTSPTTTFRELRHDLLDPSESPTAQSTALVTAPVPDTPAPPDTAKRTAPRRAASEDLNERFMTALSERIQRRPAPLPTVFQPMAEVIAPGRRVMLSTDDTSRRALRSVGKVAATVDDVIHLDAPSPVALATRPDAKIDEIVAHELTHTAHPSPVPRFFDDIDDSPEERTAEAVARIMATSSLAPSASVAPAPTRTRQPRPDRVESSTIRRSVTGSTMPESPRRSPRPDAAPGFVSAASLAARAAGSSPSGDETIRRSLDTPAVSQASERVQRRASSSTPSSFDRDTAFSGGDTTSGQPSDEWFVAQLERNMDLITRRLEERMIVEFERRGGRMWGGL